MLDFIESDNESLTEKLAGLQPLFVIEHAETDLFQGRSVQRAGIWGEFFDYALNRAVTDPSRGTACNLEWITGVGEPVCGRRARWIEVKFANQKFIAALMPHLYSSEHGGVYLDHRFVIAATKPEVGPVVLLFKDFILGHASYADV